MPLSLRKKMIFLFSKSNFLLISFQKNFERISNLNYFQKLKLSINKTHTTNIEEIREMNSRFLNNKHFILLGVKND